jgi:hypothetical protein
MMMSAKVLDAERTRMHHVERGEGNAPCSLFRKDDPSFAKQTPN